MSHQRERRLFSTILSDLHWSPAVGLYGLRQVGKTTLLNQVASKRPSELESFDREATLRASRDNPVGFCTRSKTLCLDEAQKGPWVFSAIKELIGTRRKPGGFLLTGSVRFTAKKEIREALTGRIILHELLPFDVSEVHKLEGSDFLSQIFDFLDKKKDVALFLRSLSGLRKGLSMSGVLRHYRGGGMPIPCFTTRDEKLTQWLQGFFETLLMLDLSLVDGKLAQLSLRQGWAFLRLLALSQGQAVQYSDFAGQTAIRPDLAKRLLDAFEVLSLIDRIPPEALGSRPVHKMRIEWKDVALWRFAAGISTQRDLLEEGGLGTVTYISQEFRSQLQRISPRPLWSFYRSHDGAHVPWIFRKGNGVIALLLVLTENPSPFEIRSLKRFIETEKNAIGIVLGSSSANVQELLPRVWLVPFTAIF